MFLNIFANRCLYCLVDIVYYKRIILLACHCNPFGNKRTLFVIIDPVVVFVIYSCIDMETMGIANIVKLFFVYLDLCGQILKIKLVCGHEFCLNFLLIWRYILWVVICIGMK